MPDPITAGDLLMHLTFTAYASPPCRHYGASTLQCFSSHDQRTRRPPHESALAGSAVFSPKRTKDVLAYCRCSLLTLSATFSDLCMPLPVTNLQFKNSSTLKGTGLYTWSPGNTISCFLFCWATIYNALNTLV